MGSNMRTRRETSPLEIRGSGRPSDRRTPFTIGALDNYITLLEIRSNITLLEIRASGVSPAVLLWAQICELGAILAP